jgi:hypothetical protein
VLKQPVFSLPGLGHLKRFVLPDKVGIAMRKVSSLLSWVEKQGNRRKIEKKVIGQ